LSRFNINASRSRGAQRIDFALLQRLTQNISWKLFPFHLGHGIDALIPESGAAGLSLLQLSGL